MYVSLIWIAIGVFLAYIYVQIMVSSPGEEGKGGFGLKHMLSSYMYNLSEQGHENIVNGIITVICIAAFVYLLIQLVKSLRGIVPENTQIGRSILKQMKPGTDFKNLCQQIDNDMAGGYKDFGGTVFASSSWIFEEEAMCLKNVQTVYSNIADGGKDVILKDTDGNSIKFEFVFKEFAAELMEYLEKYLPMADFITDGKGSSKPGKAVAAAGVMYSWHIPKTPEEASYYKKLAEEGDAFAQTEYGKCLLFGKGGITPDGNMAYQWFEKAAAQSYEIAKMYAGHCILYGIGTKKNEIKGWEMLDAALNYNYPEESSSQPLADYSEFTHEDLVQLFWDLGDALEKSLGVIQNYDIAIYYFNMINHWGHNEGAERMSHYKQKGSGWVKTD